MATRFDADCVIRSVELPGTRLLVHRVGLIGGERSEITLCEGAGAAKQKREEDDDRNDRSKGNPLLQVVHDSRPEFSILQLGRNYHFAISDDNGLRPSIRVIQFKT
jgi:hypothetical protein